MELILTDFPLSPAFLDEQVKEIQDDLEKLSPHTIKHTKKVRCNYPSVSNLLAEGCVADGVCPSRVHLSPFQHGGFL